MRGYHNTQSFIGTNKTDTCDGGSIDGPPGGNATIAVGCKKSDVIESDGLRPTPFTAVWVGRQSDGKYYATQPGMTCYAEGKKYYTVRKDTLPYAGRIVIPGFINFNGIQVNQLPAAVFNTGNVHNAVDMAILQKIADQKLSLGVTAGETKETVNLLLDLAEDLLSVVKYVKSGLRNPGTFIHYMSTKPKGRPNLNGKPHWSSMAKANDDFARKSRKLGIPDNRRFSKRELNAIGVSTQAAANRWLQYRYGTIPVYNDLIKIFDYIIHKPPAKELYTARVTIPLPLSGVGSENPLMIRWGKGEGFQQMKVWFSISDHKLRDAAQRGLDITSLPSIAWELTPFSFMVDWFYPIGDSLQALSATRGLKFEFGYRSQKYEVKDATTLYVAPGTAGVKNSANSEDASKSAYGAFQRVLITSFPLVRFPVVENPFGIHTGQRITDVLAIGRQLFFKPYRPGTI